MSKVSSASGHNMTDDEFQEMLKQHPELWGVVMDVLKNYHSETQNRR